MIQKNFKVKKPFTFRGKSVAKGDSIKGTVGDFRNLLSKGYIAIDIKPEKAATPEPKKAPKPESKAIKEKGISNEKR